MKQEEKAPAAGDSDGEDEDPHAKERVKKLEDLMGLIGDEVDLAVKKKKGDPVDPSDVRDNLLKQKDVLSDLLGPKHKPYLDDDTQDMLGGQLAHVNKRLAPKKKKERKPGQEKDEDDGEDDEEDEESEDEWEPLDEGEIVKQQASNPRRGGEDCAEATHRSGDEEAGGSEEAEGGGRRRRRSVTRSSFDELSFET